MDVSNQRNIEKIIMLSQSSTTVIEKQPRECDILCGKDRRCQAHTGSRRFRKVIDSYQQQYQQATNKQQRMAITKEIYSKCCRSNSRFLKLNEETQQWQEISPLAARDKIGHALRGSKSSKAKSTSDKRRRHHRRNNSDSSASSLESIYSEATTASSSSWSDGDFSFLDDLVEDPSLTFGMESNKTQDPFEPLPISVASTEINHPLQSHEKVASSNHTMEPLPIDVTVDLSFLLTESHITYNL